MLTQDRLDELAAEIKALGGRLAVDDEAMKAMHEIYVIIYAEAYDPGNDANARMVERLIPHVRVLNAKFKFKK